MREKPLPGGGRVDLVLGDEDSSVRYEVEVQLGKTDPSHIIRMLEYWDIERKLYPESDHVAVLIAEEITSRFFNVISLFNGVIPIIALQMKCIEMDNSVTVVFSKILDLMGSNIKSASSDDTPVLNREYWEKRAGNKVLDLVDKLLSSINQIPGVDGKAALEYRKGTISVVNAGQALAYCMPYKNRKHLKIAVKLSRSTEMDKYLSSTELDVLDYNARLGRYRVRLEIGDESHLDAVTELINAGLVDGEA